MLVITDVKYDVHDDKQRGEYFEYYTPTFEPITLRPPQGDLPDWSPRTERVIPRTYVFRLPARALQNDHRVQALKNAGLVVTATDTHNERNYLGGGPKCEEDRVVECRIKIGFVNKDDNVVISILEILHEAADNYLDSMVAANRSASKSAARVLELEAQLTESNRWYQEMLSDARLVRRASFWQRLKWLFTGVQI